LSAGTPIKRNQELTANRRIAVDNVWQWHIPAPASSFISVDNLYPFRLALFCRLNVVLFTEPWGVTGGRMEQQQHGFRETKTIVSDRINLGTKRTEKRKSKLYKRGARG
jgi:hypothetical protein